jgi:hypothetical protein
LLRKKYTVVAVLERAKNNPAPTAVQKAEPDHRQRGRSPGQRR